jgi:hypothetical protein
MTRKEQNRNLTVIVAGLLILIAAALAAKLSGANWALQFYEFIRDTSLLIVTVVAAYMAHIYQKRTTFLQNLREQWKEIVEAKAALIYYCHLEGNNLQEYLIASRKISETIDNMRIVYRNVGETDTYVGLYPYSPLHYMHQVMQTLDPRRANPTPEDKFKARGEMWNAFNALREHFVEEFDIGEPTRPILIKGMKRKKQTGAAPYAMEMARAQREEQKSTDTDSH